MTDPLAEPTSDILTTPADPHEDPEYQRSVAATSTLLDRLTLWIADATADPRT